MRDNNHCLFFQQKVKSTMLLQLKNISKSFSDNQILQNINLEVNDHERIALVGRNGTGKSTLLKIIVEQIPYDSGEIIKKRDMTVGFLDQEHDFASGRSIWDRSEERRVGKECIRR